MRRSVSRSGRGRQIGVEMVQRKRKERKNEMKKEQGVKKEWKKWIEAYEVEGMRREHRGMRRIRRRGEGER